MRTPWAKWDTGQTEIESPPAIVADYCDADPDQFFPCLQCVDLENWLGRVFWVDPYGNLHCRNCSPPIDLVMVRRRLVLELDDELCWRFRQVWPDVVPVSPASSAEPRYRLIDPEEYFAGVAITNRFLDFGRGKTK